MAKIVCRFLLSFITCSSTIAFKLALTPLGFLLWIILDVCDPIYSALFYLLTPGCTFFTHLYLHDLPLTERPSFRHFLFMLEKHERPQYLQVASKASDRAFYQFRCHFQILKYLPKDHAHNYIVDLLPTEARPVKQRSEAQIQMRVWPDFLINILR